MAFLSQNMLRTILTFSLKGGTLRLLLGTSELPASLPLPFGGVMKQYKGDRETGTETPQGGSRNPAHSQRPWAQSVCCVETPDRSLGRTKQDSRDFIVLIRMVHTLELRNGLFLEFSISGFQLRLTLIREDYCTRVRYWCRFVPVSWPQ